MRKRLAGGLGRADGTRSLRAGEGDVGQPALGLHALPGGPLLVGDLEGVAVGELALLAGEELDLGPLATLGAVDGRQLDAVLVVADGAQRAGAPLQHGAVLGDAAAGRLGGGLVEDLQLDLLRAAEGALVLGEVLVEPTGAAQDAMKREASVMAASASRMVPACSILERWRSPALRRGEALAEGAPATQPLDDLPLGLEGQAAVGCAADEHDVLRPSLLRVGAQASRAWRAPRGSNTASGAAIRTPRSRQASATVRSRLVVRASTTISPRRRAASTAATAPAACGRSSCSCSARRAARGRRSR